MTVSEFKNKVLHRLSDELVIIARELDELEVFGNTSPTKEQMVAMQKMDLFSQKLNDISALIETISNTKDGKKSLGSGALTSVCKLEHTRSILVECTD
jgi:protein-tyrosine phosphatase